MMAVASLILIAELILIRTSSPSSVLILSPSVRSLTNAAVPATTRYSRTASSSLMLAGSSRWASFALGSSANAPLAGAKTVNGPLAERASTSLPALMAVTRVDSSGWAAATFTMLKEAVEGLITLLMMWMTPLEASISVTMAVASLILIAAELTCVIRTSSPWSVVSLSPSVRSWTNTAAPATT